MQIKKIIWNHHITTTKQSVYGISSQKNTESYRMATPPGIHVMGCEISFQVSTRFPCPAAKAIRRALEDGFWCPAARRAGITVSWLADKHTVNQFVRVGNLFEMPRDTYNIYIFFFFLALTIYIYKDTLYMAYWPTFGAFFGTCGWIYYKYLDVWDIIV